MPVVVSRQRHPLIGSVRFVHPAAETVAAGEEHIVLAYIDDVVLRRIIGQLVLAQDRRKKTYGTYSVRPDVRHISRHTGSVAQAGNCTGGDLVRGVYHVNQVADGIFQFMLAAQLAVVGQAFPEVSVVNRTLFERPFVHIRHDEYHRLAAAGSDIGFESVDGIAFVLPRALVTVDTVQQI